jgi:SAM-dependent methyltransferase
MSDPREKRTEFDAYAGRYAELIRDPVREKFAASNRFFAERKLQVIERFCRQRRIELRNRDWLDAGCGQGELLRLGGSRFRTASGCDPSAGMLESCPELNVRLQPSIDALPFEDRSFDFLTLVCVYHHVARESRDGLTHEARRLLRPGGILCVVEHNPINPVTRRIVSRTPVDADAELLSAKETARMLRSAGFRNLASRFFLFVPERFHNRFPGVENVFETFPVGGQYAVFGEK